MNTALRRAKDGEEEAEGTVRRMGKVFLDWSVGEGLDDVAAAAASLLRAKEGRLVEAGHVLREVLEELVAGLEPGTTEHLVVVAAEDNPDDAVLLRLALAAEGRTVHVVPTAADVEELLAREEVALLVLDLFLPDLDGRTLLAEVREQARFKDLTVVVLSGKASPAVEAECLALGANAFIRKPLDPTALAAVASSALHQEARRRFSGTADPLTHLLNRKALRELWGRWRFPEPSSIGILGIDGFAALEERFDHEVSDSVVAAVGGIVRDLVPRGSPAARWGEAEVLILFPGLDRGAASHHLASVLSAVRVLNHSDPEGETFRVTASGGVAEIRSDTSFDDAVDEAQALLEEAMRSGGNMLSDSVTRKAPVTVLVAEDDPLTAGILQHRLEKEGFRVLHFPDGEQALEGAVANSVDVAILDVKMPGMDGFELLERLRKIPTYYELPILMLTSMGRAEDIARGFELGADDYMVKPFSPVEVLARLRRLLER